jgi:hypothetical protein
MTHWLSDGMVDGCRRRIEEGNKKGGRSEGVKE